MFFAYGQERMIDEGRFMAKQASRSGALIHFHQYNALPHIFATFMNIPQTIHLLTGWANFCRACVEEPEAIGSSKYYIHKPLAASPHFETTIRDVGDGTGYTDLEYDEVLKLMNTNKKKYKIIGDPKSSL